MADINLSPYTAESEAIARKMRLADVLQQQSMMPIQMPTQPGVHVSPLAGLAKMLQAYKGAKKSEQATQEAKTLAEKVQSETLGGYQKLFEAMQPRTGTPEGAPTFTPNVNDIADNSQMQIRPERDELGGVIPTGQAGAGNYGVTPGAPAVAAKGVGLPSNFDITQIRNPEVVKMAMAQQMAQMQAQAEAERKRTEPRVLSAGQGVYGPKGEVLVQAPFAPKEPVRPTADVEKYNLYVKQTQDAGKKPLDFFSYETELKKASRPPAAVTYGSPVAATDANGNPVFLQTNRTGGAPSVIEGFSPPSERLKPIPPSVNTAIIQNQTAGNQLDRAIALVSGVDLPGMTGDKSATGLKGYLPNAILNRVDPKGVSARAEIADIGSLKLHDRSGAAVTASESPRLMPFIPLATDDKETVLKKLNRLKLEVANESNAMKDIYSKEQGFKENPILNKPSVAEKITTMQEIQEVATKTGKSIEQVTKDALAKGYKVQ